MKDRVCIGVYTLLCQSRVYPGSSGVISIHFQQHTRYFRDYLAGAPPPAGIAEWEQFYRTPRSTAMRIRSCWLVILSSYLSVHADADAYQLLAVENDGEYAMKEHIESVLRSVMNTIELGPKTGTSLRLALGAQHLSLRSGHALKGLNRQLSIKQAIRFKDASMPCRHCGMEFDRYEYEKHLAEAHDDHHGRNPCIECDTSFTQHDNFLRHLVGYLDVLLIACDNGDCDRRFARTDAMKVHFESAHVPDRQRTAQCPVPGCQTVLFHETDLRAHLLIHGPEQNLTCDKAGCGKNIKSSNAFWCHVYRQHKKKKERCPGCGRWYKWLTQHLKDTRNPCKGNVAAQRANHGAALGEKDVAEEEGDLEMSDAADELVYPLVKTMAEDNTQPAPECAQMRHLTLPCSYP